MPLLVTSTSFRELPFSVELFYHIDDVTQGQFVKKKYEQIQLITVKVKVPMV